MAILQRIEISEAFPDPKMDGVEQFQLLNRDFSFWDRDAVKRNVDRFISEKDDVLYRTAEIDLDHEWLIDKSLYNSEENNNVIAFPPRHTNNLFGAHSVNTLEEWECVVSAVEDGVVLADAKPMLVKPESEIMMEIPVMEFTAEQRSKLQNGLIFRLIVGLRKNQNGTQSRESTIYIRNFPKFSKNKWDKVLEILEQDD